MLLHNKAFGATYILVYIGNMAFHIKDALTFPTFKMIMLVAIVVVAGDTIHFAYIRQFAQLCQLVKIPVNRGFADGGVLLYNMLVNIIGSGVVF